MAATTGSFLGLLRPDEVSPRTDAWRWTLRRRLVPVRDQLLHEHLDRRNAWLSARAACVRRERDGLLARLDRLSTQILVTDDTEDVAVQLRRLLVDIEHHHQRLRDLAYDDVEIEIGGSG
jgi:hypothetical protein